MSNEQTTFILYNTQKLFFNTSENENPELYKNGGRSAMLHIFPGEDLQWKGEDLQCCRCSPMQCCRSSGGEVCNVANLPGGGEGLQCNTGSLVENFQNVFAIPALQWKISTEEPEWRKRFGNKSVSSLIYFITILFREDFCFLLFICIYYIHRQLRKGI